MRTPVIVAACAALLIGVAGCEEDPDGILIGGGSERGALAGFWTGTAEITTEDDEVRAVAREFEKGVRFRVALRLRRGGGFTLRVFNYPVSRQTSRRVCTGVWEREGRILEFFPNAVCRALPLSRYVIGRQLPDGLTLEANTRRRPHEREPADIRVFMRLERD